MAFVLIQTGAGRHTGALASRPVQPGDVLVLSGKGAGRLLPAGDAELVFHWFTLRIEHLYPLFDGTELSVLQPVMESFRGVRHFTATDPSARETHRLLAELDGQASLQHRSQLLRAAAVVLSLEFTEVRRRRSGFVRIEDHIVRVFEELSNAEILNSSVAELAARFGCSRRHLNRLFHNHFGISVSAFKMEMRLLRAMFLLRNPDAKVINVAEDCGFNHLGLFNTCFRRRFGCSPGQWRESVAHQPAPAVSPGDTDLSCRLRVIGLCPWTGGSHECGVPVTTPGLASAPGRKAPSTSVLARAAAAGP